jgi:hypothetical protein
VRAVVIAFGIGCIFATPALSKVFELPDANPAVTVDLPGKWKPSETDKGVEATSPDGETYIAVETATARGVNQLIDEDIEFLGKAGVSVDRSTQQTKDTTVNGIPVSFLHWKGKDKDGPTAITLGIFGVTDNLLLLLTAWSSAEGDKANGDALDGILSSIKRR